MVPSKFSTPLPMCQHYPERGWVDLPGGPPARFEHAASRPTVTVTLDAVVGIRLERRKSPGD